jgi:hypothetical protein
LTNQQLQGAKVSKWKLLEGIKELFSRSAAGGYVSPGPDKVVVGGCHQHLSRK